MMLIKQGKPVISVVIPKAEKYYIRKCDVCEAEMSFKMSDKEVKKHYCDMEGDTFEFPCINCHSPITGFINRYV